MLRPWQRLKMSFRDRTDAGRRLAATLAARKDPDPVVLALPRGGLPVAAPVAEALGADLDLAMARKIGAPSDPELAVGAVADGLQPVTVRNESVIAMLGLSPAAFAQARDAALAELARRRAAYLAGRPPAKVAGRTAIVVDDGIATGASVRAALRATRTLGPARLVLAAPVAAADTLRALGPEADEVVCLEPHEAFGGVGLYYRRFDQVSDDEVRDILARHPVRQPAG